MVRMKRQQYELAAVLLLALCAVVPRHSLALHGLSQESAADDLVVTGAGAGAGTYLSEDRRTLRDTSETTWDTADSNDDGSSYALTSATSTARLPAACRVASGMNSSSSCHGTCQTCEATAASRSRRPCKCCKAGFVPSKGNAARCDKCPAGFISSAGAVSCTACPPGLTTTTSGSKTCNACQAGRELVITNKKRACVPCAKGSFIKAVTPFTTATKCKPCPRGRTTMGADRTRCGGCRPGYASASCRVCPKGTYSPGGPATTVTKCIQCPAGTTTAGAGATSASACDGTLTPNPSPSPMASATISIMASGTCNDTVSDMLVGAVKAGVMARTPADKLTTLQVKVESCTVMNNNRTRALLQTEPQAMFVIGVTLEDTIRNLEAVLESQVLLQSLQTELGKVGRTLVSVDVNPADPNQPPYPRSPSPPPTTSPAPPGSSPAVPNSPSVPQPPIVIPPVPDTPATPGPVTPPPNQGGTSPPSSSSPSPPPTPAPTATCKSRNHTCTTGILMENVVVAVDAVLSDGLCCKPISAPQVTVSLSLNEPCDAAKAQQVQNAFTDVAIVRLGSDVGLITVKAQCGTSSVQASGSGRALLEFDSTVVVTLGVPSSANTAVDKAEQSSTALLKFFGLEANATNPTLEDLGQMLEEAAQEGSQAFQAVEAVVESALDNAGIEANFTVGVQEAASCFMPGIPGAYWHNTCGGVAPGTKCTGPCSWGFDGQLVVSCQLNGTWSEPIGRCIPSSESPNLPCLGQPPTPAVGYFPNCTGDTFCEVLCGGNYKLDPRPYSRCDATTGKWSDPIGVCKPLYCSDKPWQSVPGATWPLKCYENMAGQYCNGTCIGSGTGPRARCTLFDLDSVTWKVTDYGACVNQYPSGATCGDTNGGSGGKPQYKCPTDEYYRLTDTLSESIAGKTEGDAMWLCCIQTYRPGATCNNTIGARLECPAETGFAPWAADVQIAGIDVNSAAAREKCCKPATLEECPNAAPVMVKDNITGPILNCRTWAQGCPADYPFALYAGMLDYCLPQREGSPNCTSITGYSGPPVIDDDNGGAWVGCNIVNSNICPAGTLAFTTVLPGPYGTTKTSLDSCRIVSSISNDGNCSSGVQGTPANYTVNFRNHAGKVMGCGKLTTNECPMSYPVRVGEIMEAQTGQPLEFSDCFALLLPEDGVTSCSDIATGSFASRTFPIYDAEILQDGKWPSEVPPSPPIAACVTKPLEGCPEKFPAMVISSLTSNSSSDLAGCMAQNMYTLCPAEYPMAFIYNKYNEYKGTERVHTCRPVAESCYIPVNSTSLNMHNYSIELRDKDGTLRGCKEATRAECFSVDDGADSQPYNFTEPVYESSSGTPVLTQCRATD